MYCVVAECGGKALWYFYCGVYRASAACVDLLELQLCVVNQYSMVTVCGTFV